MHVKHLMNVVALSELHKALAAWCLWTCHIKYTWSFPWDSSITKHLQLFFPTEFPLFAISNIPCSPLYLRFYPHVQGSMKGIWPYCTLCCFSSVSLEIDMILYSSVSLVFCTATKPTPQGSCQVILLAQEVSEWLWATSVMTSSS